MSVFGTGFKSLNHVSTRDVENVKKEIKATLDGVKSIKNLKGDKLLRMRSLASDLEGLSKKDKLMSKSKHKLIKATMAKYTDAVGPEIKRRNNHEDLGQKPKQTKHLKSKILN